MKKIVVLLTAFICFISCKKETKPIEEIIWQPYDETSELAAQANHENARMRFKLLNSKLTDKNTLWQPFEIALANFSQDDYEKLKPLILEQNIPSIQKSVQEKKLTYEELTLFFIYRIRNYEHNNAVSLNAVITLNPNILKEARELDKKPFDEKRIYSLYGMPILLKDNVGASGMYTTAGAAVLAENNPNDAFIVDRLKANNALILGKTNLSEWAYYFCDGCPLGYSAIGGQTLNPYGRKLFETGGSSSGSGVAVAANYAVAAVGTETSGSILSPSSQNSVVGLKPTVGLLSRTGIVPISSTLDTPGPMTKNVMDNAIFLNAMTGKDSLDTASMDLNKDYLKNLKNANLKGKRLGVIRELLTDSIYATTVKKLGEFGAEIIEYDPPSITLNGFLTLLNIDMKNDLSKYLENYASDNITLRSIEDVVAYNQSNMDIRAPYGQQLFEGIVSDATTPEDFERIKNDLHDNGKKYFATPMEQYQLDAVLSINNYHAGYAAVAKYPCLTVPMGYKSTGEPISLTFIGKPFTEDDLLKLGYAFEKQTKVRKAPKNYQ
ncbi:amidase family protein [Leptobacterium sp. I13]|uniref:amidase family protein n=1 Tax=Leptobacterium meishanense TaxID=3128904 RepID=UPI0030EC3F04